MPPPKRPLLRTKSSTKSIKRMINTLQQAIKSLRKATKYPKYSEQLLLNQGKLLSLSNAHKTHVQSLAELEWKAFSQWGEDGILDWLIAQLPGIPESFVEFGVENYREANTRYLLQARNWKGMVIDGSASHIADIQGQDLAWRHWLTAVNAFITAENINELLKNAGFSGEIGLLSVDIDGNDYWVWEQITEVQPVLVVVEYNAVFGDLHAISTPYDPAFVRNQAHYSNQYFGASLPALNHLAEQKGYQFLGTNRHGVNAFYVRNDHAEQLRSKIAQCSSYPSRLSDHRLPDGSLGFVRGEKRSDLIRHLKVVEVKSKQEKLLGDLGPLYSAAWKD